MDYAVALVQAYLRVNGYFTVTEYPVLHSDASGTVRTATDLDVLAFRFPRSGEARRGTHMTGLPSITIDPALGATPNEPDMLIGEVKEGKAQLNTALINPRVVEAALVRFGCCSEAAAPALVSDLLARGTTTLESGHRLRLVSFGSLPPDQGHVKHHVILLGDVVRFLQDYVRDSWEALRHADLKDPGLGFFSVLHKALQRKDRPS